MIYLKKLEEYLYLNRQDTICQNSNLRSSIQYREKYYKNPGSKNKGD